MSFRKLQDKMNQVIYSDNGRKAFGLAFGALALVLAIGTGHNSTLDSPAMPI